MTSGSGLESGSGTNVWSKHELFVLSSSLSSEIEIEIEADCAPQRITSLSKVPQVISTTKTLRRCCGFILALLGFSFYSLRGLYLIVSFIKTMRSNNYDGANYPLIFGFGAAECAVAIFQFWIIIRYPRLTLKELNIKVILINNIFMYLLYLFLECMAIGLDSYIFFGTSSLLFQYVCFNFICRIRVPFLILLWIHLWIKLKWP